MTFYAVEAEVFHQLLSERDTLLDKLRTLRKHVRKDGTIKQAQPKDVALAAAERMTEKHGKTFTAYPCQLCNGMWHVGHLRGEDTP